MKGIWIRDLLHEVQQSNHYATASPAKMPMVFHEDTCWFLVCPQKSFAGMVPSKVKGQTSGQKVKSSKWYYICIVGFLSIHGTDKKLCWYDALHSKAKGQISGQNVKYSNCGTTMYNVHVHCRFLVYPWHRKLADMVPSKV